MTPAAARKIALSFAGAEERVVQGGPAVYVGKALLVRIGTREPDTLMLRTETLDMRDTMIAAQPELFFITDHFKGYNGLLVRLSALDAKTLRALLQQRMAVIGAKKKR